MTDTSNNPLAAIESFFAKAVNAIHKEASLVLGILAAFNVTPSTSPTEQKVTSALLIGYSAITHGLGALSGKTAPPSS